MRIIVLPVGRCRFLEENESGLRFRRNKIWRFTECTTPYNRPANNNFKLIFEVDTAHCVPSRSNNEKPKPIVCRFVRRLAKETVMNHRRDSYGGGIWKRSYISTIRPSLVSSRKRSFSIETWGIFTRGRCVLVWTENILKTNLSANADVTIVTIFRCSSFTLLAPSQLFSGMSRNAPQKGALRDIPKNGC